MRNPKKEWFYVDEHLGKVIGRQGRTVRALRTLLDARGDQDGERYQLDILD